LAEQVDYSSLPLVMAVKIINQPVPEQAALAALSHLAPGLEVTRPIHLPALAATVEMLHFTLTMAVTEARQPELVEMVVL